MNLLYALAQVTIPTKDDNPWIWLCGALTMALVYIWFRYDKSREAELERERALNEKLTGALPEIIAIMREWKDAQSGRTPSPPTS